MNPKQEETMSIMREILQEGYLNLRVQDYTVREDLVAGTCRLSCSLRGEDDALLIVEGEGVGTIDALFNALRTALADDYPSLRSIEFSQFEIRGLMSSDQGQSSSRAQAEATVGIRNSAGREFVFKATEPSISHAGIEATLKAAEYFVNSERTFVRLHGIVDHYRAENRSELVQKYTALMAQMVENTSYSEVVERLRTDLS